MKYRILPLALSLAISIPTANIFAATVTSTINENEVKKEVMKSIKGNVLEINEVEAFGVNKPYTLVTISDDDGKINSFKIDSEKTYIVGQEKIAKGMIILCYYDSTKPTTMIYPPQYFAEVVDVRENNEFERLKFDFFDKELISSDGMLKLNIDKSSLIFDRNNQKYDGEIREKNLAIFYGVTTKSIPAQTTPVKVVVLSDDVKEKNLIGDYVEKSGVIKSIKLEKGNKVFFVSVENGGDEYLATNSNTYFVDSDLKVGDKIVAFAPIQPVPLIFPPRFNIDVIAENKTGRKLKADSFDENFTSFDGSLKLNINDSTEMVDQAGEKLEDLSLLKNVLVFYKVSTKSIPAVTIPEKIVKLNTGSIKKDNLKLKGLDVTIEKINGFDMVQLRDAANALNLNIFWDNQSRTVYLGENYSLTIDVNAYVSGSEVFNLECAPTLKDGKTYVPASFFTKVIK